MILFNTTFHIHTSISDIFLEWVRSEYIPAAKAAGIFSNLAFLKILIKHDPDAESYAVQMLCEHKELAEEWHDSTAADLRGRMVRSYGERILFFTTYMEVLEL